MRVEPTLCQEECRADARPLSNDIVRRHLMPGRR
jgi:hypothetical protein